MDSTSTITASLVDGQCLLIRKLGTGSFSEVWLANNITNGEMVALKMEKIGAAHPKLGFEKMVYHALSGGFGIPRTFSYEQHNVSGKQHMVLAMEPLGSSLREFLIKCDGKFSLKTTLMLADQMLERIEFVHGRKYIHRDIKPENFLMGLGTNSTKVYLIDFGLALRYLDPVTGAHIYCHNVKNLIGTARFASLNAHLGFEQCRRDDLESIGYMLVYFMNGSLPWMLERKKEETKNYLDRIKESKRGTTIDVICKDLPSAFRTYLSYCRALGYKQEPDYEYLREIFKNLFKSRGFKNDYVYDWMALPENDEDNNCQSQIKVRYVKKKSGCIVN